mgnify:FL=1
MPHDRDENHVHNLLPAEPALRVKALETILLEKGLLDQQAVDAIIDEYEKRIGPQIGAKIVARAWSDPAFKSMLIADSETVLREAGLAGRQGEHVVVVENTNKVHNLVVCTLCSCYPWPLLGVPPAWYKSDAYRSRAVSEPRKILSEFGVDIPKSQSVRVWDSTAEIRYLVLPLQPKDSIGLPVQELAKWVTRNSMIGTGLPLRPVGD